jgi:crotonobetaine/carnitine-CoA ligase
MYIFLPLFHVNPQLYGIMSSLYNGSTVLLDKKFSIKAFWDRAQSYRFTTFTYVGTVLSLLCKKTDKALLHSSIKQCVGGGAPKLIWEEVTRRFGIKVMELYGMTELGGFTTANSKDKWKFNTAGRPRDCMDVRIFDENDRECAVEERGEIVVRPKSPHVIFDGYFNQPDKTLESIRNLWFHTGDRGYFDREGFLHYEGRIKEIIRRKGENISPFELETIIQQHTSIEEATVVGIPDDIAEEEIKLCIVLKEGDNLPLNDFCSWLEDKLPHFMMPRYIEFFTELPKTATQKVEKNKLKSLSSKIIDINQAAIDGRRKDCNT